MTSLVTNIPSSGLSYQSVPTSEYPEYFRHLEEFLPADVLAGKRKVVILDWVRGGGSVNHFATVLEAYWKANNIQGELIKSGFNAYNDHPTGFDFVGKAANYGVGISDGNITENGVVENVAPYEGVHNINSTNGRLEDLKPNEKYLVFRKKIRANIRADKELDGILAKEFSRFLKPAK